MAKVVKKTRRGGKQFGKAWIGGVKDIGRKTGATKLLKGVRTTAKEQIFSKSNKRAAAGHLKMVSTAVKAGVRTAAKHAVDTAVDTAHHLANDATAKAVRAVDGHVGKVKSHVERLGLETRNGVLEHNK